MLAIFDFDNTIYTACFAGERRNVLAKHIQTGFGTVHKNQTEFFGRKKNEVEGWLGEENARRVAVGLEPYTKEDFELETIRSADAVENVLHTVKSMIGTAMEATGATEYTGYIGKGESFRLDRSTIYKYKGNREDVLRPLLKDEVTEYLIKHHSAEVVEGVEADDAVIIRSIKEGVDNSVVIAVDKDNLGNPVKTWNPNRPELGIIDGRCFGELNLIQKAKTKEVKGYGRKFFYYQVGYGDDVDNYRANSASETNWGMVSAYDALAGTKNDRDALEALVEIYKHLYPEPKVITGWRGDEIEIDWLYVLRENWDLARMLRHEDDVVDVKDVLTKYKLI